MKLLMHMVFKVAKTMAPSVIYIDDAEKLFKKQKQKKKPELEDEDAPLREFKKSLIHQFRALKPGDRVLVIGNSKNPTSTKSIIPFFNKIVFIPLPEYGSRQLLWSTLIAKEGGKINEGEISQLTRITENYSAGSVSFWM